MFLIDGKVRTFDGYKKIYDEYVKPKYSSIPDYHVDEVVEVIESKVKEVAKRCQAIVLANYGCKTEKGYRNENCPVV